MDLIMEDKPSSSDSPLSLSAIASSLSIPQMSSVVSSSSSATLSLASSSTPVTTSMPSFTSGIPTLLPQCYGTLTVPLPMNSSPIQLNNSNATSKYAQLLSVIEELGRDIRPTYSGSKSSAERLKRGIIHARILVRECLMETERNNARN